ncbi:MAG: VWA domain-containing protein [Candidatus Obscuribacterales bacterium]|nr:VWA domain-containing protein [Candidatus Obscuribacterales bacterium]
MLAALTAIWSGCCAPYAVAQEPSSSTDKAEQAVTDNQKQPSGSAAGKEAKAEQAANLEYSEDRHANFIFLVDVSGSMVLPRTMVKGADGSNITLFEALRAALKQIAQDPRILSSGSKVSFITFGTAINEKSDWPTNVNLAEDRSLLLSKINSPTELQADKHGDTYMAGALEEAFKKASKFSEDSAPCTTNFILMLTDGWDEPPPGATLQIRPISAKIVAKEREIKDKLGVNTWQVRVIGLQRLPEKKSGTTTAAEVAALLGGEFLDVTKAKGGTVAEQIYMSLKKTIEELKGQIDVPKPESQGGIANFGKITETPRAKCSVNMTNKSCYVEKITQVREVTNRASSAELAAIKKSIVQACSDGRLTGIPQNGADLSPVSTLPTGAIRLLLSDAPFFLLAPLNRAEPKAVDSSTPFNKVTLALTVGPNCPPGSYFGLMDFASTAKIPGKVAYTVIVPSRYFVEPEMVASEVKKQGFFLNQPSRAELAFDIGARVNSSYAMDFQFAVEPAPLHKKSKSQSSSARIDSNLINKGKTINVTVNTASPNSTRVKIPVDIPAETEPGLYVGELKLICKNQNVVAGPAKLACQLTVIPSPWDEMSPIAIPVFVILILVILTGIFMLVVGNRERF